MEAIENTLEASHDARPIIGNLAAALSIAALIIAAFFWVFSVHATATSAKELSEANAKRIEEKADKAEVSKSLDRISDKLDKINDYLINHSQERR
jgi:Flp pilus assembly protein TadB